jgi:hypothetical protein
MYLKTLVLCSIGLGVAADGKDWKAQSYDAIVTGAGPAGIIGLSF